MIDLKGAIAASLAPYGSVDLKSRAVLIRNLVFIYHTMRASEHLLETAIDRAEAGTPLHAYFVEHLEEERRHERWLAGDLASVGIDVANTPIPRQAVELVGTQYYLIHHVHPAALLGYMALMECFPTPVAHVEELEAIHGPTLLRCLRYHAEHDIDHGADVLAVVADLPEGLQALVLESGVQSAHYFGSALRSFQ